MGRPLIIYVPGLRPKPTYKLHREALLNCLLLGLQRVDAEIAAEIRDSDDAFDIVSWTFDFYGEHRDIEQDRASIEALIAQGVASPADISEASSFNRRALRWIFGLGDLLPFLVPLLAPERSKMHLKDFQKYEEDADGIGQRARDQLKLALLAATANDRPILLIGHSMGSIISYDTLWGLSHLDHSPIMVDLLITMGSPLGQRFMQNSFRGRERRGKERYPLNIRTWKNFAAHGDLTAIDPYLANDFAEMQELGLVEEIDDERLWNFYRHDGVLNPHSEYGYLINEKTAHTIAKWWRGRKI